MAGVKPLRVLNSTKQFLALKNVNFSKTPFHLKLSENNAKALHYQLRFLSTQTLEKNEKETKDTHNIINENETLSGDKQQHQFQSDTKMLLDIVAKSLYSDKEVFLRELISNASDALEKLRYKNLTQNSSEASADTKPLEIHISTDKQRRLLIIQDTGIGMTIDELKSNLGTIAHSGSKGFLSELKQKGEGAGAADIIGQFGVGFYSSFMVADKVEVYTKSHKADAEGLYWSSKGDGSFEIAKADGVQLGTKIILHLRPDCRQFCDEETVNAVIQRYSNFVGSPIFVNGKQVNSIKPLWMLEPSLITNQEHTDFYHFISNSYDDYRFVLHYITDAPINIRALLYFPTQKPSLYEVRTANFTGVSLYSRKILIKHKIENILPTWMRFMKGVIDSEDIPLNLSRELLQDSALIIKIRKVLTMKVIKFLQEKSKKHSSSYLGFYSDYHTFLKEGIIVSDDPTEKAELGKLLMYESSKGNPGQLSSFSEYCERLTADQKDIYYLSAPNRTLAEQSPYLESFSKRNIEVLFCYEPFDEIVLMQLKEFNKHNLISVEKDLAHHSKTQKDTLDKFTDTQMADVISNIKTVLKDKVFEVKTTDRLETHPCVVTVEDMAAARHFIKTQSHQFTDEMRFTLLQPKLEINPNHVIIKKLAELIKSDPETAKLLTQQLFMNAMVSAGLVEDSRILLNNMNKLLSSILEKK